MPSSSLPPGTHNYESILEGIRSGAYRFARIRSASGRLNHLIGISPEQLAHLRKETRRLKLGFILLGSRVSGPHSRQRQLDGVLRRTLALKSTKREASATYLEAQGVEIHQVAIKELGLENVQTSDLSVILVDLTGRPEAELSLAAVELEKGFRSLGCPFPVKVFPRFEGRVIRSEKEFLGLGRDYLKRRLPPGQSFSDRELKQAFRELYMVSGLQAPPLTYWDLVAGLWNAALVSLSFSLMLRFHPVIPLIGFLFGAGGRYLARLKTWIADAGRDGVASNSAALVFDAALGTAVMAGIINPLSGLSLEMRTLAGLGLLHTLSKGSLRLYLDKIFSRLTDRTQLAGVIVTCTLGFLQDLMSVYIYAGNEAALGIQILVSSLGLFLVFKEALMRPLRRFLDSPEAAPTPG